MVVSRLLFLIVFVGLNLDVQDWKTKRFARKFLRFAKEVVNFQ